ncbi:hypothetical protein [Flavobacterium psychrotrophum]|uniref:hypothetical protein n=1 Tax=Flavobacterium psychrotrophum TaxID=2294119 RepID=UPI000E30E1ED|nr:hypothetical protein [Flavobacterium psychrotrophum]
MKTTLRKFMSLAIIAAVAASCGDDDNNKPSSSFVANPAAFQGEINDGEVTLDGNTTYHLTGRIVVKDGATLTIPAGTVIEGVGGTQAYIAVAQGGKINVNGTAAKPVIMTSGLATKKAGDWGGLVLCGKAPINRGTVTAQAEVSDLTYGGTIANDNSGSIKYLVVKYSGAQFTPEKEFNGISFFGVGSGTTVENVAVVHGSDDGFEFFGGTVNTTNLVSWGNEDDQFDWTEGWSGTNTNWYAKLDYGKGNRGIEADNFEFGYSNAPIANPTITNMSLVGPGSTADATAFAENSALKLRRGTKGNFSNVVIANWKVGFDVENDETLANVTAGSLKATNVLFAADVPAKSKGKDNAGATVTVAAGIFTESATATGAGSGVTLPSWASTWVTTAP